MEKQQRILGVVLAGGKGTRFTGETPKQFTSLGGVPVLWHSVQAFEQSPHIHGICIVTPPAYADTVRTWATEQAWHKVRAVVVGGAMRCDSVLAALKACGDADYTHVLLHDAARPLLPQAVIARLAAALQTDAAVTAALPAVDTVAVANPDQTIDRIPPREALWQVQTPQGFDLYILKQAYAALSPEERAACTDDGGIVRRAFPKIAVRLVQGDRVLQKLTYPQDTALLASLLAQMGAEE